MLRDAVARIFKTSGVCIRTCCHISKRQVARVWTCNLIVCATSVRMPGEAVRTLHVVSLKEYSQARESFAI